MNGRGTRSGFNGGLLAKGGLFASFLALWLALPGAISAQAQTELGSEDDLTVLGQTGTALDPDTEIKGFTVFGSTQAVYTGAIVGPGNVVVNGVLAVSTGAYFVGNATFTAAGKIYVNDGAAGQLLRKNAAGYLEWATGSALGDDLGSHVATTTLNLAGWNLVNVSSVNFLSGVFITSAPAAQFGGIYISTHIYLPAGARLYGDGSGLTGTGDNLGSHTATQNLNLASFNLLNVSSVNFRSNVFLTSATAANYGGVYTSTHIYTPGNVYGGNIYTTGKFYGDGSSLSGVSARNYLTIALPTVVNDATDIGEFDMSSGAHNLYVAVTVSESGFSVSKQYALPLSYNLTGANWRNAIPLSNSVYGAHDFALEVRVNANIASFRLRRVSGVAAANAVVSIEQVGSTADAFTQTFWSGASTASGFLPVTAVTQYNNNVGIGTLSPGSKLDVAGNVTLSGSMGILSFASGQGVKDSGSQDLTLFTSDSAPGPVVVSPANSEAARFTADMKLGIGTQAPAYRLVVSSGAGFAGNMMSISTGTSDVIRMTGDGSVYANRYYGDGSNLTGIGGTLSGGQTPKIAYWTGTNSLGNASLTQDSGGLTVLAATFTVQGNAFSVGGSTLAVGAGRVGVGTGSPASALHVQSPTNTAYAVVVASGPSANDYVMTVSTAGRVTLGGAITLDPVADRWSLGVTNSIGDGAVMAHSRDTVNNGSEFVLANGFTAGGQPRYLWEVFTGWNSTDFHIWDSIAGRDRFVLQQGTGNVGISTGAPQARLDVLAATSAQTDMAQIWRRSTGVPVASMTATGALWVSSVSVRPSGSAAHVGVFQSDLGGPAASNEVPGVFYGTVNSGAQTMPGGLNRQRATLAVGAYWDGPNYNLLNIYNNNNDGMLLVRGDGAVGIGQTAPYARLDIVSTGTASNIYAQIWRNSGGVIVASMTSQGTLYATLPPGAGDNLGNHTATADLNMGQNDILNVASMTMVGRGLQIGTDLTATASGVFISTAGSLQTLGAGNGTATPNGRGNGAVDLQTNRGAATQVASGNYAGVLGGALNTASAQYSVAAGGYSNTATGEYSVIAGGNANDVTTAQNAFVGGGYDNNILSSGIYGAIAGGYQNYINANYGSVAGGYANRVGGSHSGVLGGMANQATGSYSAVLGGLSNTAAGNYSTVLGGNLNTSSGTYSLAAGRASSSTAAGAFTWADSAGVVLTNNVADRTWFKNRGGFLVTGSTQPSMDGGFFVSGAGSVGIGTTTPMGQLHVNGRGAMWGAYGYANLILSDSYASNPGIGFTNAGNWWGMIRSAGGQIEVVTGPTGSPARTAVFDTSNNVGIGVSAPAAAVRLDVQAGGSAQTDMATVWRNSGGTVVSSVSATGVVMASKFVGDGSGITGLSGMLSGGQTPKLAYWTGANTLGNAELTRDGGTGFTVQGATFTVQGNAFSVGGSTLTVAAGKVGIGVAAPDKTLAVQSPGGAVFKVDSVSGYVSMWVNGVEMVRMKP